MKLIRTYDEYSEGDYVCSKLTLVSFGETVATGSNSLLWEGDSAPPFEVFVKQLKGLCVEHDDEQKKRGTIGKVTSFLSVQSSRLIQFTHRLRRKSILNGWVLHRSVRSKSSNTPRPSCLSGSCTHLPFAKQ